LVFWFAWLNAEWRRPAWACREVRAALLLGNLLCLGLALSYCP
jgi:hypothetical protein